MDSAPKDPPEAHQIAMPPGTTLKKALRIAEERARAAGPQPPDYAKHVRAELREKHGRGRR